MPARRIPSSSVVSRSGSARHGSRAPFAPFAVASGVPSSVRPVFAATLLASILCGLAPASADELVELVHGSRTRRCGVHVPPALASGEPLPLVLVFHGAGGNGRWQVRYSGFVEKADEAGFVLAYPDGTGWLRGSLLTWNAGACCGYASNREVDDLGFVRELLDVLLARFPIDPSRVYAAGLSNGGMFCYRVADVLSDRFAAIGVVAGTWLAGEPPSPARPVPVVHFHGTRDRLVPFDGGSPLPIHPTHGFRPVRECAGLWARANGCRSRPEHHPLPDRVDDHTRVILECYLPVGTARARNDATQTTGGTTHTTGSDGAAAAASGNRTADTTTGKPAAGKPAAGEPDASDSLANSPDAGPSIAHGNTTSGPTAGGAEVLLYVIEGGGHTWPGRLFFSHFEAPRWMRKLSPLGRTTLDIDATDLMWDFFRRHRLLPSPGSDSGPVPDADADKASTPAHTPASTETSPEKTGLEDGPSPEKTGAEDGPSPPREPHGP